MHWVNDCLSCNSLSVCIFLRFSPSPHIFARFAFPAPRILSIPIVLLLVTVVLSGFFSLSISVRSHFSHVYDRFEVMLNYMVFDFALLFRIVLFAIEFVVPFRSFYSFAFDLSFSLYLSTSFLVACHCKLTQLHR